MLRRISSGVPCQLANRPHCQREAYTATVPGIVFLCTMLAVPTAQAQDQRPTEPSITAEDVAARQLNNRVADERRARAHDERIAKLTSDERRQLATSEELHRDGKALFEERRLPAAIGKFQACFEIQESLLGQDDRQTLSTRAWLPYLYKLRGDYGQAKAHYQQIAEINRRTLGDHPETAKSLHRLAVLLNELGEFGKAKERYEQSLLVRQKVWGHDHRGTALAHNSLGLAYMWTGEYAAARPHLEKSLKIIGVDRRSQRDSAANLQNQALLNTMMGDLAAAEPLYKQALEHAAEHPDVKAQILDNRGLMYTTMGEQDLAREQFERALETYATLDADTLADIATAATTETADSTQRFKQSLQTARSTHPLTLRKIARTLNNLGWLYASTAQFEKAERLYHRSLIITHAVGGEEHSESAACHDNLGRLYQDMGESGRAETQLRQALAIRTRVLGDQHVETAVSKSNLGLLKFAQGDRDEALLLIRDCLRIRRRLLDETATVQNERQQLLMNQSLRRALDDWLSVADSGGDSGADDDESVRAAYAEVLRWKGAVFVRQAAERAQRQQPELKSLVEQLRSVSGQLARLAIASSETDDREKNLKGIVQLGRQREQLERQLRERSADYRRSHAVTEVTLDAVQDVLPEQTALVDLVEYKRYLPAGDDRQRSRRERRMAAFVVRGDAVLQRVELGSAAAIDDLVDRWRGGARRSWAATSDRSAQDLRRRVWEPLEEHLRGVTKVLISPDGSLGKLPFPALPGRAADTFLLHDYATAVMPVPQTLVAMLRPPAEQAAEDAAGSRPNRMLVVSNVDYAHAATETPVRKRRRTSGRGRAFSLKAWSPLPATELEGGFVRKCFVDGEFLEADELSDRVKSFEGASATEERVRQLAPRCTHLHFATHGFFAPQQLVSALEQRDSRGRGGAATENGFLGYDPGLLSGIVLAGANRPADRGDDGVLTALEVAELDLSSVKLAVLSACETGLGRVAGGEGLLGLQRAFQMAGARRVLASLWVVDDVRTQQLMVQFYRHYYDTEAETPLETMECLRQAQLYMLEGEGSRGFTRDVKPTTSKKLIPPHYWAGFVLSGDSR